MRDKLVDLLDAVLVRFPFDAVANSDKIANYLIAHGVTLQQWVPVDERKPDLIPNSAGTAYSNAVNCLTSGRKVITAIWDGEGFIGDAAFWEAEDEIITHWTPVLLPLPKEVDHDPD